jgi:hypoxanthine-DNA glycosylase
MKCLGFPPIIGPTSKVLILGTIPGKKSLEQKQYYADRRNHFWTVVFSVLGKPIPTEYSERIACLLESGLALWDVLASCDRQGSGDRALTNPVANDFSSLFAQHRFIRLIAFNGRTAEKLWKKFVKIPSQSSVDFKALPSTSSAFAVPLEEKLSSWSVIRDFL